MNPIFLSRATAALLLALIAIVFGWRSSVEMSPERFAWTLSLTVPLWLPLLGVLRRHRTTYAWATLCVIPYFILGITEAIANPQNRSWAGLCLALALALFVTLILYLRITSARGRTEAADKR